jgi:hypothetical protein
MGQPVLFSYIQYTGVVFDFLDTWENLQEKQKYFCVLTHTQSVTNDTEGRKAEEKIIFLLSDSLTVHHSKTFIEFNWAYVYSVTYRFHI